MRSSIVAAGIAAIALVIVACSPSGAGTTDTPASAPPASAAPTDVAAACAESSDAPAVSVAIRDFTFAPGAVTIKVGDTVAWSNKDGAPHTATLDVGDCTTGNLAAESGAGSLVFGEAGEFAYHCSIHPQMKATITVTN